MKLLDLLPELFVSASYIRAAEVFYIIMHLIVLRIAHIGLVESQ
jgi:hypothetical protein